MNQSARWPDISVVSTEHAPATQEIQTNSGANTLSVALLPVERASWRIDDGPTLTRPILPGTTSIRASRKIVWAGWEQTCKCIHVGLAPRLLDHVAREAGMSAPKLGYCEGVHDPLVLQCALVLAEEAASGGRAGDLYVQSIANILAVHILRRYAGAVVRPEKTASMLIGLKLERVKDYIESNLAEALSLDRIASVAAMSSYHFARRFKAATGLSPHRYVTQRRIELAKVLLNSTSLPIADIARRVGIPSQSHFTAHFRKLVGCTPKEFRRRS
jgi:AraC family transcriptional regulator